MTISPGLRLSDDKVDRRARELFAQVRAEHPEKASRASRSAGEAAGEAGSDVLGWLLGSSDGDDAGGDGTGD
jgi:hypothetical protein